MQGSCQANQILQQLRATRLTQFRSVRVAHTVDLGEAGQNLRSARDGDGLAPRFKSRPTHVLRFVRLSLVQSMNQFATSALSIFLLWGFMWGGRTKKSKITKQFQRLMADR